MIGLSSDDNELYLKIKKVKTQISKQKERMRKDEKSELH